MLMTLSCQAEEGFHPRDLGYLVHKHPDRAQTFAQPFGRVHVFYPQLDDQGCTLAVLLDIDAVGLVRRPGQGLEQYVNDRPYAASSFFSVAMNSVFKDALLKKCKARPELVELELDWRVELAVVRCQSGTDYLRGLFEPLGYQLELQRHALDEIFGWREGPYYTVQLRVRSPLHRVLNHLYILLPVLDKDKHYYVDRDELEKLLRKGEGWLAGHPLKKSIVERYLRFRPHLTRDALARLQDDNQQDGEAETVRADAGEEELERPVRLHDLRLDRVCQVLKESGLHSVADLGCGAGKLVYRLKKYRQFHTILAMDVSYQALVMAREKLKYQDGEARLKLLHGSLLYRDSRLQGCEAVALVEVIEHLDLVRLRSCERNVFGYLKPMMVVVTTPNRDYNRLFPTLSAGSFRHRDHRFEWSRQEFQHWCESVCEGFGYRVEVEGLGPKDEECGCPSQMAVFRR